MIVLAEEDAILLGTDPSGTAGLMPHLAKYGVFDDVVMGGMSGVDIGISRGWPRGRGNRQEVPGPASGRRRPCGSLESLARRSADPARP